MESSIQFPSDYKVNQRVAYLIAGFLTHTLNGEERGELDAWITDSESNMKVFEELTDDETMDLYLKWYSQRNLEARLEETRRKVVLRKAGARRMMVKYGAAACLIGITITGIYFLWPEGKKNSLSEIETPAIQDIEAGSSRAVLKMEGGKIIYLASHDSVINSGLMIQDGALMYSGDQTREPVYHEIIIPRKGSYSVVLPDGTKVWLNAESSIRYPTAFVGSERRVTVTGETYFEVRKDSLKPFLVTIGDLSVEALGTRFNVNAYPNENAFRTTLEEGAVRVARGSQVAVLAPDQQLEATMQSWKLKKRVDVQSVTSWVHNQLRWKDASIQEIMRQVERWYDAKVVYEDSINYHFNGTFNRSLPVSKILTLLEETGHVHFTIEDKTITVRK
jgi:transmembrane sensor